MSHTLFSGAPRPGKMRARTPIHRIKTTETQQFTLISRAIYGQLTHWHSNRSHECRGDRGACERCRDAWPQKWRGYIHALNHHTKELLFLEITETASELLIGRIPRGENLRGLVVRMSKTKGGAKGRFVIDVLERRVPETELPQEEDPYPTLTFLWNCKNNPVPS